MGRDVVITIDAEMQKKAYQLLNGRRGAIVLLLVQTGEPLVLASFPSYDPRKLGDVWDDLSRDPSHPLLNRAVAGLYPPGSTFKVMTAAAGLDEMTVTSGQIFHCDGSYSYGDYTLYDSSKGAHGGISLADAITVSCNVTFAQVGRDLGLERISSWMEKLKLTARSEGLPGSEAGVVPQVGEGASGAIQAGFGQGSVLVTPFGMARLAALIGREGKDIEPSLRSAELVQGSSRQTASGQARQVLDAKAAAYVKKAMRRVVEEGTGGAAAVKGHTVAGKTGTAENAQGEPHAWFIGFAPAEEPLFAVAVVVENAGYGGRHAAPIAASVLETALNSRLGPSNGR